VFGTDMSSVVLLALLVAPLFIIPGVLIGLWGHGRAIPPPGDYVMETLPIYGRYHRVHSLRGRTAVFGTLLIAAVVLAVVSGVAGNLGFALLGIELAVFAGGVAYALHRSTQLTGDGPRLSDRFGNARHRPRRRS
jgi:hypothetical protein